MGRIVHSGGVAPSEEHLSRSKCNQPNLTTSKVALHMSRAQLIEFGF